MPILRETRRGKWMRRPRNGQRDQPHAISSAPDKRLEEVPLKKPFWRRTRAGSISSDDDFEEDVDLRGGSDGIQLREVHDAGDAYRASGASDGRRPSRLIESCKFIWPAHTVAASLRALPGGEGLWSALEAGEVLLYDVAPNGGDPPSGDEALVEAVDAAVAAGHGESALLISAWCGRPELIRRLLEQHGVSAMAVDGDGRTPMHLACCAGDEECVKILLHHGGEMEAWDYAKKATPLHCAACSGSSSCINIFIRSGVNVNLGIKQGKTPLYYAVQVNSRDCVKLLLGAGANPNTPQVFSETPLHVAAAFGFSECIKLLLEGGADVRVHFGPTKATALHLSAQDGNADCARLLLDAGADTESTNHRLQTPLHLAALAQSTETLELLIQRGADLNAVDVDKRTPLHCAIVKESRSCECVRLLLKRGANVNCADAFGYTPLHLAALHEFSSCVGLLINSGADVMARTKGGVSALTFVVRRTPDTLPCFIERLDSSVTLHDHDIGDADCEIKLDFRALLPSVSPVDIPKGHGYERQVESGMLLGFVEVGMRHLLKHPLCEIFLFLKWRRIRKFILISLTFHLIFVALYTTYIIGVFSGPKSAALNITNSTRSDGSLCESQPASDVEFLFVLVGYVLIGFNTFFLLKEMFQVAHGFVQYAKHWENWLQLLIILCVYASHGLGHKNVCDITPLQHHVAALGIAFTWTDLMVLIGRFPTFGVYVQMFTTVSINFSKFLLAYCCLLIGFGLGLGVLFPLYPAFHMPYLSLLKSVIMMSGELEYEDIFFSKENKLLFQGTSHVMFLAFVILVTVILTNLLVGLAVSDIQGLQKTARLNRLVRLAELIAHWESIMFSRLLLSIIPLKVLKPCLRGALLVSSSPYNRTIHLRPNDPRENRVPRHLLEAVYDLIASRSGKKKHRSSRDPGPGSRRNAFKTWAGQYSLVNPRRTVAFAEEDGNEDVDFSKQQGQVLEYISAQINSLVADVEAREAVVEDIRLKLCSLERSISLLSAFKDKNEVDEDSNR
ncbi:transient receptor potential channel pyrexia-like [Ischnura elegans]|uniref:transient receptor potential channel pyrexia-like n=1 Tax=Ischnura elegans TaxID=197161 RepID=UPI001ED8A433|nr:transient receptor potential channel pyrexia-like [Ischnura elegans]